MHLKSLSATAAKSWTACPAMATASNINRVPQAPGVAADLGSAVHKALEFYVKACHTGPIPARMDPTLSLLVQLYDAAYREYFGDDMVRYNDGMDMIKKWHARTEFGGNREVVSTEVKQTFSLGTSAGPVPFNFIFDRVDIIRYEMDGVEVFDIDIVDYKSWVMPRNNEGLDEDIQVRCYALAGQIMWPEARRIWVNLDQLRYDSIGTVFTRDQNIETYRLLQRIAEEIIAWPEDVQPPEKLNSMCRFCVRRHSCKKLQEHGAVGGPLSLDDPIKATDQLARISGQITGLEAMKADLEAFLLGYAEKEDIDSWDGEEASAKIKISRRRGVDAKRAAAIVGDEVFARYGGLTMANYDAMIADPALNPDQKRQLKSLVQMKAGNPRIVAEKRSPLKK